MSRIVLDLDQSPYPDIAASVALQVLRSDDSRTAAWWVKQIEAQLPKPKPLEPTGRYAVVEDTEGREFCKIDPIHNGVDPVWQLLGQPTSDRGEYRAYREIDAVSVLSEGVPR